MGVSHFLWLPIVSGTFYFLLFAPVGIRKSLFRQQSPEEHFWRKTLAFAIAAIAFFLVVCNWNLVNATLAVACSGVCIRGGYLLWHEARVPGAPEVAAGADSQPVAQAAESVASEWPDAVTASESVGPADGPSPGMLEPHLSILHLLGLAVCVAVYFGVFRTIQHWAVFRNGHTSAVLTPVPPDVMAAFLTGAYGLGEALAASGLLVLAVRRWRGLKFPTHPGEFLWILLGTHFATTFVLQPHQLWISSSSDRIWILSSLATKLWLFTALTATFGGFLLAVWIWAAVNIGSWRWRGFLGAVAVVNVLTVVLRTTLVQSLLASRSHAAMILLSSTSYVADLGLIALAYLDHRDHLRRPWTHWTGVLLRLWFAAVAVGNCVRLLILGF